MVILSRDRSTLPGGLERRATQYVEAVAAESGEVRAARGDELFRSRFELDDDAPIKAIVAAVVLARSEIAADPVLLRSAGIAFGNALTASAGTWSVVHSSRPEVLMDGQGIDVMGIVLAASSGDVRPAERLSRLLDEV